LSKCLYVRRTSWRAIYEQISPTICQAVCSCTIVANLDLDVERLVDASRIDVDLFDDQIRPGLAARLLQRFARASDQGLDPLPGLDDPDN
jgi:hypothetical protein